MFFKKSGWSETNVATNYLDSCQQRFGCWNKCWNKFDTLDCLLKQMDVAEKIVPAVQRSSLHLNFVDQLLWLRMHFWLLRLPNVTWCFLCWSSCKIQSQLVVKRMPFDVFPKKKRKYPGWSIRILIRGPNHVYNQGQYNGPYNLNNQVCSYGRLVLPQTEVLLCHRHCHINLHLSQQEKQHQNTRKQQEYDQIDQSPTVATSLWQAIFHVHPNDRWRQRFRTPARKRWSRSPLSKWLNTDLKGQKYILYQQKQNMIQNLKRFKV